VDRTQAAGLSRKERKERIGKAVAVWHPLRSLRSLRLNLRGMAYVFSTFSAVETLKWQDAEARVRIFTGGNEGNGAVSRRPGNCSAGSATAGRIRYPRFPCPPLAWEASADRLGRRAQQLRNRLSNSDLRGLLRFAVITVSLVSLSADSASSCKKIPVHGADIRVIPACRRLGAGRRAIRGEKDWGGGSEPRPRSLTADYMGDADGDGCRACNTGRRAYLSCHE
jgi:hypothetical protein